MSRINETSYVSWHENCACKCRLDASVCNDMQSWNSDKCRCDCKELIGKVWCDNEFIWNPSICECKCDKSCDVGEYLYYANCKCRKILVDKLFEECRENINASEMICNVTLNDHGKVCKSCTIYIDIHSIINYNFHNAYGHWQYMHLFLLAYNKKLL